MAAALGISVAGQRHAGSVDRMLIERVHMTVGEGCGLARLLLVPADTPTIVAVALMSCVAALARRRWDVALLAIVTPVIGITTTELVLKPLFGRRLHGYLSYPSGHAIAAVAGYTVVALALASTATRRWRRVTAVGWGLVVVIVMGGLVGMDWHYPTDAIGGVCVAVGVVLPCAAVTDSYLRRPPVPIPPRSRGPSYLCRGPFRCRCGWECRRNSKPWTSMGGTRCPRAPSS